MSFLWSFFYWLCCCRTSRQKERKKSTKEADQGGSSKAFLSRRESRALAKRRSQSGLNEQTKKKDSNKTTRHPSDTNSVKPSVRRREIRRRKERKGRVKGRMGQGQRMGRRHVQDVFFEGGRNTMVGEEEGHPFCFGCLNNGIAVMPSRTSLGPRCTSTHYNLKMSLEGYGQLRSMQSNKSKQYTQLTRYCRDDQRFQ